MTNLLQFMTEMAQDTNLQETFREKPAQVLATYNLTAEERAALNTRDSDAVSSLTGKGLSTEAFTAINSCYAFADPGPDPSPDPDGPDFEIDIKINQHNGSGEISPTYAILT